MLNTLKNNKTALGFIALAIAGFICVAILQGCSLSDMIPVKVPAEVQTATGTPAKIKLSEAPYVREKYVSDFTLSLRQFDGNIEQAAAFRDLGASLINTGITAAEGPLAGLPLGGILLAGLAGLGGLYLPKPGTSSEIAAEKQASYNKGLSVAKELVK